jgi:hypothetical protein
MVAFQAPEVEKVLEIKKILVIDIFPGLTVSTNREENFRNPMTYSHESWNPFGMIIAIRFSEQQG